MTSGLHSATALAGCTTQCGLRASCVSRCPLITWSDMMQCSAPGMGILEERPPVAMTMFLAWLSCKQGRVGGRRVEWGKGCDTQGGVTGGLQQGRLPAASH